jgi:hypothetical protein
MFCEKIRCGLALSMVASKPPSPGDARKEAYVKNEKSKREGRTRQAEQAKTVDRARVVLCQEEQMLHGSLFAFLFFGPFGNEKLPPVQAAIKAPFDA